MKLLTTILLISTSSFATEEMMSITETERAPLKMELEKGLEEAGPGALILSLLGGLDHYNSREELNIIRNFLFDAKEFNPENLDEDSTQVYKDLMGQINTKIAKLAESQSWFTSKIHVIPPEVFQKTAGIFSKQDLLTMGLVSKNWQKMVEGIPSKEITILKKPTQEQLDAYKNFGAVTKINFSENVARELTDDDLNKIIEKFTKIKELDLSNCHKITDVSVQEVGKLKGLTALNLTYCLSITDNGLAHLKELQESLEVLNLSDCREITNGGIMHLLALINLKSLNISRCENISDSGVKELWKLNKLQSLNLDGCKITDGGIDGIENAKNLEEVFLGSRQIRNGGLKHLSKLIKLQSLSLANCSEITDEGLENLKDLKQLRMLNLGGCYNITDAGIKKLEGLSDLKTLSLFGCSKITDVGLESIGKFKKLKMLSLGACHKITDVGLTHLMNLKDLESLDLRACVKITYKGLEPLVEALPKLNYLNLVYCDLKEDEVNKLKTKFPNLKTPEY